MRRKRFKILCNIMRYTKADKILISYIVFAFVDAALIWISEPTIRTYPDALWYCYAVISTAGFGDMVVTAFLPKILSVALTAYSLLVIAIVTGVVVNFYTQMIEIKNQETLSAFLDRLERLTELSAEEREKLSEQVKRFRTAKK